MKKAIRVFIFILAFHPEVVAQSVCGTAHLESTDTIISGFLFCKMNIKIYPNSDTNSAFQDTFYFDAQNWRMEISGNMQNFKPYDPPSQQIKYFHSGLTPCDFPNELSIPILLDLYPLYYRNNVDSISHLLQDNVLYVRVVFWRYYLTQDTVISISNHITPDTIQISVPVLDEEDLLAIQWLQQNSNNGAIETLQYFENLTFKLSRDERFSALLSDFISSHSNSTLFPFAKVQVLYNDFFASAYQLEGHKSKQQLLSEIEALRAYLPNPLLEPMIRDVEAGINIHLH